MYEKKKKNHQKTNLPGVKLNLPLPHEGWLGGRGATGARYVSGGERDLDGQPCTQTNQPDTQINCASLQCVTFPIDQSYNL